jgi:hypothetical protein
MRETVEDAFGVDTLRERLQALLTEQHSALNGQHSAKQFEAGFAES